MPLAMLLLFLLFGECWARLVNITIDDTYGDARTGAMPSYEPKTQWIAATNDEAQNNTLHDLSIGNGNFTLTFEGVRIYVFLALPDSGPPMNISCSFYLDGESEPRWRYVWHTDATDGYSSDHHSNVLVYRSTPLPQRKHSLTVTIDGRFAFFDYALYTGYSMDDGTTAQVSQLPSGSSVQGASLTPSTAQTETTSAGLGTLRSATVLPLSPDTETPSQTSGTPIDNPSRSHTPRNRPALIYGPAAAAVVMLIGLSACFCVWRRRQRVAASSDGTTSRFFPPPATGNTSDSESMVPASDKTARPRAPTRSRVTPYIAQPDPAPAETAKERRRAAIIAKQNNPSELGTGGLSTPRTHAAPVDIGAELERMLAQNARAREELEMLRQAVEPPPYSRG